MCRSLAATFLAGMLSLVGACESTAFGGPQDAAPDADALAADDAGLDADLPDAGPTIVQGYLARDMFLSGWVPPMGDDLQALFVRNALGDPPGAKQFLFVFEAQGAASARVTYGVGEKTAESTYRFTTDPAPAVVTLDCTQTAGRTDCGGLVDVPFVVSVTPDAPDPASLLVGLPTPGLARLIVSIRADGSAGLGTDNYRLTPATACPVWLGGHNLLEDLVGADCTVDLATCSCPCCSTFDPFDFSVAHSDRVSILLNE